MPKFLFELALFCRARLDALWARIIFDWIVEKVKDEWLDHRIEKHQKVADNISALLERERARRASIPGA